MSDRVGSLPGVFVHAQPGHVVEAGRVVDQGWPISTTARITDHQPTPSVRAVEVTVSPSAPTRRVTHALARPVSDCRGAPSGERSVHVRTGHVGRGQRQIRFHHTSTVGRPATGTSRSRCSRRSWTWAGPPHRPQSTATAVDSTRSSSSPPYSPACRGQHAYRARGQSAGGPTLLWNDVARDLVEDRASDLADSALLFGMLNLGGADAATNCWNDKYYRDFWRPWHAHRALVVGVLGARPPVAAPLRRVRYRRDRRCTA